MEDSYDLERFVKAQDSGGTYRHALDELHAGLKRSHWMWFVFPQLAGLGRSPTARTYAVTSLDEAKAYLRHPVLGPRLVECAAVVAGLEGRTARQIFGGIDERKLHSSMTLFLRADPQQTVFQEVLAGYFDGVPDAATDRLLGLQ
ncbi:uncharacterized protein (DUF1810 family) [Arthrobacter ginsengisoli]|uniref:Uncharacterized protein (DUF1810 family) n=1 Tax=Arthrobacter ginsengisoli TaxID=1356565 RepID=A0ABU1UI49_9MICC|nr:DUF1810 domain-containing protein [Arthrobacter ginsengisoli]MDR7084873.1 uncharacterized protein (DUF1810 family) [Arthrobacter ginsengisoli]